MKSMKSRVRLLAATAIAGLLFVGLATQAQAQPTQVMAANESAPDIKKVLEKHNCAACHGNAGISPNDEWPNIAGQNPELIRNQLKEFRDGRRANTLMSPAAKLLNDSEIDLLANYFAAQHPGFGDGKRSTLIPKRLEEARNISGVCMSCHGNEGISRKPDWSPNLAGQKKGYLWNQFKNFRDGTRSGEFMPATMHFLKDTDFEILAELYSSATYPVDFDSRQLKTIGVFGKIEKIADGMYQYSFANWRPIFLTTSKGVVLFDPPSIQIAQDIKKKLGEMGLKVAFVILTHPHGDHTGGASVFADEAIIVSSRKTKETLEKINIKEAAAAKKIGRSMQLEAIPSLTFTDRMVLSVGDTDIELESPATYSHSDGDLIFVNIPKYKMFIAADSVSAYVIEFLDFRANPLLTMLAVVKDLEKRDFETLTNGHDFMPKSSVVVFREYLEFMAAAIGKAIRDGRTVDEVKNTIKLPAQFLPLALRIYPPSLPDQVKNASLEARFKFNVQGAYEQLKAKAQGRKVVDIHVSNGP